MTRHAGWLALMLVVFAGPVAAAKADLDYQRLRGTLDDLAADKVLGPLAPAERALAEQAVQALPEAGRKEHDHLVYIAERRVDIAYATAQAIEQERKLDQLDREHDRILLAASRRDAEQARLEAEKQRIQSMAQAEETDRLRAEAEAARVAGEQSAADADLARKQAKQTKRLADAQAKEAELARKEAQLAEAATSDLRGRMQSLRPARGAHGMQMTIDDIAFVPGKPALRPAASSNLDKVVAFVNGNPRKPIRIEGHTDNRGDANANAQLSQHRAEAVRDALVAAGVDASRITVSGRGEADPVAANDSEEGRARNRRVDVILFDR